VVATIGVPVQLPCRDASNFRQIQQRTDKFGGTFGAQLKASFPTAANLAHIGDAAYAPPALQIRLRIIKIKPRE